MFPSISYYQNAYETVPRRNISIEDLYYIIQSGAYYLDRITREYREVFAVTGKTEQTDKMKELLPAVTVSGLFSSRNMANLQQHSGFVIIDIDHIADEGVTVDDLFEKIKEKREVVMMYRSPSMDGIKAVVCIDPIPQNSDEHYDAYDACAAWFEYAIGIKIDRSGRDSSRLTFLCHDADAYFNYDEENTYPIPWVKSEKLQAARKKRNSSLSREAVLQECLDYISEKIGHCDEGDGEKRYCLAVRKALKSIDDGMLDTYNKFAHWHSPDDNARQWRNDKGDDPDPHGAIIGMAINLGYRRHVPMSLPGWDNLIDAYWSAWVGTLMSDRCVIAYGDEADGAIEYRLYYINDNGMLDDAIEITKFRTIASDFYQASCGHLVDDKGKLTKEGALCLSHARQLNNTSTVPKMRSNIGTSILKYPEAWGNAILVKLEKINESMQHIGTKSGVVDLHTGKLVEHSIARELLITASTPDAYDPNARHDAVDVLFPEWNPDDDELNLRQKIYAAVFMNPPRREFITEICEAGSGKTTASNALSRAFGNDYIDTIRSEAWKYTGNDRPHNGDFRKLTAPTRICFVREIVGNIDQEMLKIASGGEDTISIRRIYHEDQNIAPTAHSWFMGNVDSNTGSSVVRFGLAGDTDTARALRDRAKMLTKKRIEEPVPGMVEMGSTNSDDDRLFRQAVVARIVSYCVNHTERIFPNDAKSMEIMQREIDATREREEAGKPSEFIPVMLRRLSDDEFAEDYFPVPNSAEAFAKYMNWHETSGFGKPISQRAFTEMTLRMWKMSDNDIRRGTASIDGKNKSVIFYDMWTWADDLLPDEYQNQRSEQQEMGLPF